MPILWAHGGNVIGADGKASLDSEAGLKALKLWLALKPYAPRGVETYDATEVRDALMQGTAAMTIELWPAWAPSLDEADKSKVPGKIEVMPAPGETSGPAPMLGSWLVAIPADSKNQAKAREFIDFLTSPEMQKKLALEAGSPPTRASVYQDAEVNSKYRWYKAQLAALEASQPRPRIAEWGKVETILGDYLQLALIGQMEPKKALAEANEKIARALKP
jgi:multiple sugar transport system substrate-binding protein